VGMRNIAEAVLGVFVSVVSPLLFFFIAVAYHLCDINLHFCFLSYFVRLEPEVDASVQK
jgi:hypothetical protein